MGYAEARGRVTGVNEAPRQPLLIVSVLAVVFAVPASAGCVGVFAADGTSESGGWHANGYLRHPSALPHAGEGYVIPAPWKDRESNFATDELVGALVRATRVVSSTYPKTVATIGDLSRRSGGGSIEHRSHQSGRDVDVVFYGAGPTGRAEPPRGVMIHYDRGGKGVRWSPPQGAVAPAAAVPNVHFDVRRNWLFVRTLLMDPGVEVQWIFTQRDLAAKLLQQGAAQAEDPALLARATQIIRQPSDSEAHDDHMHVRIYCDPGDRTAGCSDRGPDRWWKKRWKEMTPPFGRAPRNDTTFLLMDLMRDRVPIAVGPPRLTS